MIMRLLVLLLLTGSTVAAQQWEQTNATTSSLRASGALLVSTDALALEKGRSALITYWQVLRGIDASDVYRCVDVVDQQLAPVQEQSCKKVLTAKGRRPY